jgi:hypothetical protein
MRIAALQRRLRFCGGSVRFVCVPWDAVGDSSIGLRAPPVRPLRCVVMRTARSLVVALLCALIAAIAAGCGSSSSGSGGDNDPAALVPANASA